MIQINVHCRYNNNLIKFHDYWLAKMLFHHCELLSQESSSESLYKYKGKSFKVKWGNQITPEEDSINILPFGFKNVNEFARLHKRVEQGKFGASMEIALINKGPVTFNFKI